MYIAKIYLVIHLTLKITLCIKLFNNSGVLLGKTKMAIKSI